jgi:Zn-dependent peptidase ImmA (M78 family)
MSIQTARMHAVQLAKQFGLDEKPPVNVYDVARELGLRVVSANLGEDVSGLLITNDDSSIVCLQATDAQSRKRFTLAHEIAHYVLGHQFERGEHVHVDHGNYISQRGLRASTGLDPKEIEANQFAATLLKPPQLLRAEVQKRMGKQALLDSHVSELARVFEVSEQAMTIRLSTLGLL